jgi:SP family myo-inositol transporter-like MFS transporter 13
LERRSQYSELPSILIFSRHLPFFFLLLPLRVSAPRLHPSPTKGYHPLISSALAIMSGLDLKDDTKHLENTVSGDFAQDFDIDELDSIEQTKTGKFVWLVSITAAIGGMLFGYDTGIISAVLVYIANDLGHDLDSQEKELITSITSGGAFVGAIFAGLTADKFGRKGAIYFGSVVFILGAIIQAASFSLAQMTVGRLVVGLGVGAAAAVVPL